MFLLLLSIFVTYSKEKMKENDFFFLKNLDTPHAKVLQEYKYLKRTRYGYGSIFGVSVLYRSIHPGQAIKNLDKFLWMG